MSECYKIPMAVVITSTPINIIGASLFVAVTGIHGEDTDGVEERQARLNAEASSLAKMYDTVSSYSNYPSISVCLESLGKVQSVNPFLHGISESAYNTAVFFCSQECYTMQMLN